ncbi:hypothetical protein LSAT2_029133 [Lamellibrachia satsuma]|nr:hypothetical protein LSAT2_029133 [Lamellibrachia satsuma]
MSMFEWTPTDKQIFTSDDVEGDENSVQRSPWYNQYTQNWHPMMTRAVPGYLPQHQLPAAIPDVPRPSPSSPVKRRPKKWRRSTQCLRGYRRVALLVVFLAVAMITAIGYAIYLAGKN